MTDRPNILFRRGDLELWLRDRIREAIDAVGSIDRDRFLNASVDDLVEHLVSKHRVHALEIHRANAVTEKAHEGVVEVSDYGSRISVPAHTITIRVPYTGQTELWDLRPNFFTSSPPAATVRAAGSSPEGDLVFVKKVRAGETPDLKSWLAGEFDAIEKYLTAQRSMIDRFNNDLGGQVRAEVQRRRAHLAAQEALVASIGLPLEKRPGMPDYKPVPMSRAIRPLPPAPVEGYHPEPALTAEQFDDILSLIRHQGLSFEQTPDSLESLGEEDLRNLVLAALNTHYKGQATAESFRGAGKTDIRIETEDRSAFVAECKLWKGRKYLLDGLTQLLGYLTYRDCKASLIVFNKDTRDRTTVLSEVANAIEGHSSFKRREGQYNEGEMRFVVTSMADPSRDLHCHVFVFHMPPTSGKTKTTTRKKKRRGGVYSEGQ